jgi:hypothetical protein
MQFRAGIVVWSIIAAGVASSGCATGGGGGDQRSMMATCVDKAKTEAQRSQCAWENANRMASGR